MSDEVPHASKPPRPQANRPGPGISRRGLLGGTGALAASVAAGPAAATPDAAPTGPKGRHDPQIADTDHIRTYYALARG